MLCWGNSCSRWISLWHHLTVLNLNWSEWIKADIFVHNVRKGSSPVGWQRSEMTFVVTSSHARHRWCTWAPSCVIIDAGQLCHHVTVVCQLSDNSYFEILHPNWLLSLLRLQSRCQQNSAFSFPLRLIPCFLCKPSCSLWTISHRYLTVASDTGDTVQSWN